MDAVSISLSASQPTVYFTRTLPGLNLFTLTITWEFVSDGTSDIIQSEIMTEIFLNYKQKCSFRPLCWISKARSVLDVIIIEHFLKITSSNLPRFPWPLSWIFPRSRHPGWDPTPCWWSSARQKIRSELEIEKLLNNHTEILILKLSLEIPRIVFVSNHKSRLYHLCYDLTPS